MSLLSEYVLTHSVFEASTYEGPDQGRAYLQNLKEVLLNEAVVRDLRNGGWSNVIGHTEKVWHTMGKELLKKLKKRGRLVSFPPVLHDEPSDDLEWCKEALESHEHEELSGIITSPSVANSFEKNKLVASVQKLPSSAWWQNRSPSVRVRRDKKDYLKHLKILFRSANSIMFIDPHIDPSKTRYQDFISLLGTINQLERKPLIEIHRCSYHSSGRGRTQVEYQEMKDKFQSSLNNLIGDLNFEIKIFIWDDLHDRHIISNIVGFHLGNGLDTSKSGDKTTWSRLGEKDKEDIEREFDPDAGIHKLQFKLSFP